MVIESNEWSGVSNLSFFANPRANIFIWDSNATAAAARYFGRRFREAELDQFCQWMRQRLDQEREKPDFAQALTNVMARLIPVRECVFGGNEDAIREFAARRLLDKLMYYEGRLLKVHPANPCGEEGTGSRSELDRPAEK